MDEERFVSLTERICLALSRVERMEGLLSELAEQCGKAYAVNVKREAGLSQRLDRVEKDLDCLHERLGMVEQQLGEKKETRE